MVNGLQKIQKRHINIDVKEKNLKNVIKNVEKKKITKITLGGGGIKCISQLGFVKYLFEKEMAENITHINAVSGGAIIGCGLAIGMTYDEIFDLMMKRIDFNMIANSFNIFNPAYIFNLLKNYGLTENNYIYELIGDVLEERLGNKDLTFKELYEKTGKTFIVGSTDYTRKKMVFFRNNEKYKDIPIRFAIRLSMNIPILFEPIYHNESAYLDGGLMDNFPITFFDKDEYCEDVVGLRIETDDKVERDNIDNVFDYFTGFFDIHFNTLNHIYEQEYNTIRTIKLVVPKIPLQKFDIKDQLKTDLIKIGYESTKTFFNL